MAKKNPVQVAADRIVSAQANLVKAKERLAASRENMKNARAKVKVQAAAEKAKAAKAKAKAKAKSKR